MQTILIPTDFKPAALQCIPALCDRLAGKGINLIFMHLFKLSSSESELMMLSRRNREFENISDEFHQSIRLIRQKYPQIKNVKLDFFYGSTVSMFKNYLEAHEVDFILDPKDCCISPLNRASIDPTLLTKKAGLPVLSLPAAEVRRPEASNKFLEESNVLSAVS
ncbi:hypothetical protein [Pedobacter sp. SYSU D00535]|uniref:hypothetical protein n=1 Tax=Pedobacter sp. SYSU D00535 TaxID=2810308 RepID=UPI001A9605A2|nr:hypothetical protein [Pedobacter sp. SYSU D00535]